MGNYTNKHFYPDFICNLLTYNPYTRGTEPSDISVTQLIDSPQVLQLRKKHRDDIVEDVSDRIWARKLYFMFCGSYYCNIFNNKF